MQRNYVRKKRCGNDTNLLLPDLYVLPALSSKLSVFSKLSIMNTLLRYLLLLCQSCRSLRNVSLGGRILGLMRSAYHGWLSMVTSSVGPLLALPRTPTLYSPLCRPTYILLSCTFQQKLTNCEYFLKQDTAQT